MDFHYVAVVIRDLVCVLHLYKSIYWSFHSHAPPFLISYIFCAFQVKFLFPA